MLLIVQYSDWYWQEEMVTVPELGASIPVDGYAELFVHWPKRNVEYKLNMAIDNAFGR